MQHQIAKQIILQPIEALIPYARNSRTHSDEQVAQIAASIREFGFTNPVLVDDEGGIVAGHGRVMAARQIGMTAVPTINVGWLSEQQRRAYVIADNQLAMNAGWDESVLAQEVAWLQDHQFNTDLLGFNADFLDGLLAEEAATDVGLTDQDDAPSLQAEPVTRLGDVWLLGKHRVMCGDSTSVDAVDKLMDGGRASFCFTSPPYNLGKSVALRNGARKGSDSAYNDFQDDGQWPELMRGFLNISLMKSDVSCVNVQMLSGNKFDLLKLFGEYSQRTIDIGVWAKTNPQPAMADGVMTSAFEFMWFLLSDNEPNRRIKTSSFARGTFSNVFSHATASGHDASVHGAVFPLAIAEHYIQNCSQNNDVILEFFGGTGTTLIACEKTGRHARLMELDPKYCDVIVRRWQAFTGKRAVLESTGQPFPDEAPAIAE
jgi:DNA modification methylase